MPETNTNKTSLFKEEFKTRLRNQDYLELPDELEIKPIKVENIEKWSKLEWQDLLALNKKQD
jgi:hypothetical protein